MLKGENEAITSYPLFRDAVKALFENFELNFCTVLLKRLLITLEQRFPTWGTCTPRGTFAYLKGYI